MTPIQGVNRVSPVRPHRLRRPAAALRAWTAGARAPTAPAPALLPPRRPPREPPRAARRAVTAFRGAHAREQLAANQSAASSRRERARVESSRLGRAAEGTAARQGTAAAGRTRPGIDAYSTVPAASAAAASDDPWWSPRGAGADRAGRGRAGAPTVCCAGPAKGEVSDSAASRAQSGRRRRPRRRARRCVPRGTTGVRGGKGDSAAEWNAGCGWSCEWDSQGAAGWRGGGRAQAAAARCA